ncbi:hypothetical protein QYF36_023905 [Acer negundo]|nr:hypothetical protein QYF36_023905 [Acer negundo]
MKLPPLLRLEVKFSFDVDSLRAVKLNSSEKQLAQLPGLVSSLSPRAFIGGRNSLKFVLVLRSGSVLLQEFQD